MNGMLVIPLHNNFLLIFYAQFRPLAKLLNISSSLSALPQPHGFAKLFFSFHPVFVVALLSLLLVDLVEKGHPGALLYLVYLVPWLVQCVVDYMQPLLVLDLSKFL